MQSLWQGENLAPLFPDQICGITCKENILHGVPMEMIIMASHGDELQDYICEKSNWITKVFHRIDFQDSMVT